MIGSPTDYRPGRRADTITGDDISRDFRMTASATAEAADLGSLLIRIADGDRTAFAEFYDRTSARVFGLVLRVLRDRGYSEETTQEVYLEVWRKAGAYDPGAGSPISWLITIAHRRAVDRVRSETAAANRENAFGATEPTVLPGDISDEVATREAGRQVRECLGTLTEVQAESVALAYYQGLTYREVADRLEVALPTVKSRIRDGLKRLRGCLGHG